MLNGLSFSVEIRLSYEILVLTNLRKMMGHIGVLTICAVMSLQLTRLMADDAQPTHYQALRALTEAAVEDCYEDAAQSVKVVITDEGFDEILRGARDNLLRNTKCLRFCIMRKHGLFNNDNTIDKDKVVQLFENIHPLVEKEKLLNVLHKCTEQTEKKSDNCERTAVAATCVLGELKEEGITDL